MMIAAALAVFVFTGVLAEPRRFAEPHRFALPAEVQIPAARFFPARGDERTLVQKTLARFLENGDLVLLGSSELTSNTETAPQKFFPRACGRKIISLGRAGFQSLPMLLALNDVRDSLSPSSRVSIILSPVWFAEAGTSSSMFLQNLNTHELIALAQDPGLPAPVRSAVTRFGAGKRTEFTGLYPDWLLFSLPGLARRLRPWAEDSRAVRVSEEPPPPPAANFDWAAEESRWRGEHLRKAGGNPTGTELSYYERVTRKDKLPFQFRKVDPWEREKKDLFDLSALLRSRGVQAHFILQPVHRRMYRGLEPFDRLFDEVEKRLRADGHLWTSYFAEPFDITLLQDAQHFSDSAWVRLLRQECER